MAVNSAPAALRRVSLAAVGHPEKFFVPCQRYVSDRPQSDHRRLETTPFRRDVFERGVFNSTNQAETYTMSTLNNRTLIAIAASAVLALAGPVALTAVSPVAYADDSASSADGPGDAGHSSGHSATGHR